MESRVARMIGEKRSWLVCLMKSDISAVVIFRAFLEALVVIFGLSLCIEEGRRSAE